MYNQNYLKSFVFYMTVFGIIFMLIYLLLHQKISNNLSEPVLLYLGVSPTDIYQRGIFSFSLNGEISFLHDGEFPNGNPLSPNNQFLFFSHKDKYFILNMDDLIAEEITLKGRPRNLFWSPNGLYLAYSLGSLSARTFSIELYSVQNKTNVTLVEISTRWAKLHGWSTDGHSLLATWRNDDTEQYDIFLINSHNKVTFQITNDQFIEATVVFNPINADLLVGGFPLSDEAAIYIDGPQKIYDFYFLNSSNNQSSIVEELKRVQGISWLIPNIMVASQDETICLFYTTTQQINCPLEPLLPKETYNHGYNVPPILSKNGNYIAFESLNKETHCFQTFVYALKEETLLSPNIQTCYATRLIWKN